MIQVLGRFTPLTTATDNTMLQAPPGWRYVVTAIVMCSTSTATRTFRMHLLRTAAGETPAVTNALYYDVRLAANTTTNVIGFAEAPLAILEPGQEISGRADLASVLTFHFIGFREKVAA